MSRTITIRNKHFIKKAVAFGDIIGQDGYELSYLDEHSRLTDQASEACFVVLYDPAQIGRGVELIGLGDKNCMTLEMRQPCTSGDVRMLYQMTRRVAAVWGATTVTIDGETVDITALSEWEDCDNATNVRLLADARNVFGGNATLCCATLPIVISVPQLESFANNYDEFGQYLHSKQQLGAFYSCPIFYDDNNGELTSLYVGIDDGPFILPTVPETSFKDDGGEKHCAKSFVAICGVFPGENFSSIDYQTFLSKLPKDKVSYFDCTHVLVSALSLDELRAIFSRS